MSKKMSKMIAAGSLKISKPADMGQPQFEISSKENILWIAGVGAPSEDKDVAWAYALLFHAAPDLLKACKDAAQAVATLPIDQLGWGEAPDGSYRWSLRDELLDKLKTAIAKTKGRTTSLKEVEERVHV